MKKETAIFAAGCFWGVQYYLSKQEGVISSAAGFIGGHVRQPSYEVVKAHKSGHVEAVRVVYDADVVSYEDLCKLFFEIHDPAQMGGQGPDIGPQYESGIFYNSEDLKATAEAVIALLRCLGHEVNTFMAPVVENPTEDTPVEKIFWEAEPYHQNYYDNEGGSPYCHFRIKKF